MRARKRWFALWFLSLPPLLVWGFQGTSPTTTGSRHCLISRLGVPLDVDAQTYTLEYSPNFRRHIVRHGNGTVVQSFAWLDEAVQAFPDTQRRYIPRSATGDVLPIAGGGTQATEDQAYPKNDELLSTTHCEKNEAGIKAYLGTALGWYAEQVQQFLEACPFLLVWPVALLQERLDFLLAPLPEESVVAEVNATVIDWPVQYYGHGRGAGMSVAQLGHALTVMPTLLFRDLQTTSFVQGSVNSERLRLSSYLYQETPAVVLELARKQLDALYGASSTDCVSYSYLHWKGWDFHQIRVVLQAFPGSVACSMEPGWELFERGYTRQTLQLDALVYLQHRLQISPSHLQAVLKTHSRFSYYPKHQLQGRCDFLQERLQLSSNDLRTMVLKMPSLLGVSEERLEEKIQFWIQEVCLSKDELMDACARFPSMLQYSIENNLVAKLHFLRELGLSKTDIAKFTMAMPGMWGYSLDQHFRPMRDELCARCDLTVVELGDVLRRRPAIAQCNVKFNLLAKLDFLADRLSLSPADLRRILLKSPHILTLSQRTMMEPKFDLLEEAHSQMEIRQVVLENPAILALSQVRFQNLLNRASSTMQEEDDFYTAFKKAHSKRRQAANVYLHSENSTSVERTFASIGDAADYAGISKSHMYRIVRTKSALNGKRYCKAPPAPEDMAGSVAPVSAAATTTTTVTSQVKKTSCSESKDSLYQDVQRLVTLEPRPPQKLSIHVAAQAFPSETILRGRRRAGGLALQIPSWSTEDWKQVVPQLWKGQHYRLLRDGHTLLLGYSYTRPSRPRCSLYACREGLRAARAWVKANSGVLLSTNSSVDIEIVTDSSACMKRLDNTTLLHEWGATESLNEISYRGPGPVYQINPDILYPLSKTYTSLLEGNLSRVVTSVSFRFERNQQLSEGANLAARLMYDSSK